VNTEHLRYFAQAYESRNYNAAAKRVSITPTGLVKAIKALERHYGIKLFERDELGHLTPTEYADALHHFYQNYEADATLLRETIQRIQAQKNNVIRFGSCKGMWGLMGPSFLFDLNRELPNINLSYEEYTDAACDLGLLKEHFDLAFTVAPYDASFVTIEFFKDTICFWAHSDNILSGKHCLDISDFVGQNIAIPGNGYKCFDQLLTLSSKAGIALGNIYEISELHRIYEFVADGLGLGFTLASVNELDVFSSNPDVVCVPTSEMTLSFGISYLPYHSLTNPERHFYGFCVQYAKTRFKNQRPDKIG